MQGVDYFRPTRPPGHSSVLREWVEQLPLRMQGVLLTAVRGCDTVHRDSTDKLLARSFRAVILHAHDPKPSSFFRFVNYTDHNEVYQLVDLMSTLAKSHDHLPHHYLLHLVHAAEIIGWKHPEPVCRMTWNNFYHTMCEKFHMTAETEKEMTARLCADEETFKRNQ